MTLPKFSYESFLLLFLTIMILASGADLKADLDEGVNASHLLQELILFVIAIIAFLFIGKGFIDKRRELHDLQATLDEIQQLPAQQSRELKQTKQLLSETIRTQFLAWGLSKSEKEVGFLLLKGFSLKEISTLRGTAEKTIRQQASSIYKKSGVSGRHAFSAWFIEDLL